MLRIPRFVTQIPPFSVQSAISTHFLSCYPSISSPFLHLRHITMSTRRKMVSARQRKPSEEAGDTSRATAERRSKHTADRTPEVHVPENLDLCRVAGVFKKIMQPRYVNFASLEDMFEGLEDL
ncbi:hypothetical protein Taro_041928, partial [Colocasia esculenta]|nr:hypothetical protein [Colocasia esculenta]